MEKELFIIEMLSSKSLIIASDKQNKRKLFLVLLIILLIILTIFWGIGSLVFFDLNTKVVGILYRNQIKGLYVFSITLGAILGSVILLVMMRNLWDSWKMKNHFEQWIEIQANLLETYPSVYSGQNNFYLTRIDSTEYQIKIKKNPIVRIPVIINESEVYLGRRVRIPGVINTTQLFIFPTATIPVYDESNLKHGNNWKIIGSLIIIAGVVIVGTINYILGSDKFLFYSQPEPTLTSTDTSDLIEAVEEGGLISQIGATPSQPGGNVFELSISQENELFQTINAGNSWQFVPIKVDWLRAGHYTTTDGEPPIGYWLDKTFQVAEDFSWYIYSPDNLNLYFLKSMDGGVTWQTTPVSSQLYNGLRYRKGYFFNFGEVGEGQGYVAYSLANPYDSSEEFFFFFTYDYGSTWQIGMANVFKAPIQNVSFLSSQVGFVSTKDDLYYTVDGGMNYDRSVIIPPNGYAIGGLNIFDSPSEVMQLSSTTYRAIFNFTKTGNFEGNQMDSWIYQSVDNGASWQPIEKGNEIRIN